MARTAKWTLLRLNELLGKHADELPGAWRLGAAVKLSALVDLIREAGHDPDEPGLGVRFAGRPISNAHQHTQFLLGTMYGLATRMRAVRKNYKRANPDQVQRFKGEFLRLLELPAGSNANAEPCRF